MRRALALGACALAVLGLSTGAAAAVPTTATTAATAAARTDDTTDPVRITLTRLRPAILTETDTLVITGGIANGSFTEFSDVMVQLRLSYGPLQTREQIARVTAGNAMWDGDVVYGSTVSVAPVLSVGGSAKFRIEMPVSALALSTPGDYALGIEVVASDGVSYDRRAMTRLVLPWMPSTATVATTRLAWLWPLANAPARDQRGVILGESTQSELSPGGRLRTLVDIGSDNSSDLAWIVDPALLQTAEAMSEGYLVDINGSVEPGTRSAQARSWLDLLDAATARGPRSTVWTLPYADVDANALVRSGLTSDLVRAVTSAAQVTTESLGRAPQGGLAWAPRGDLEQSTIDSLASSGVRTLVLRDTALPSADPSITPSGSAEIPTSSGPIRAVLLDSGLRESLTMRQQTPTQILLARQRFLGELAYVALEAPTIPRTLIAGPSSPRWDPSGALLRDLLRTVHATPWIDPVPLELVLADPPSQVPRTPAPYSGQVRELPTFYLERISTAQARLASLSTVLSEPATVTEPAMATLLRAESAAWRFHLAGGQALIDSVDTAISDAQDGVHVISRNDVILSGDTGSVPVTIANDLDQQVTVGLRLIGFPTARLEAELLTDVVIEAGKRASVVVPVRVVGSDSVRVSVELLDGNGSAFGNTSQMQLRTTAYSRAARWFTVGAAILLAIMVVFDIYRRVRNARRRRQADTGAVSST